MRYLILQIDSAVRNDVRPHQLQGQVDIIAEELVGRELDHSADALALVGGERLLQQQPALVPVGACALWGGGQGDGLLTTDELQVEPPCDAVNHSCHIHTVVSTHTYIHTYIHTPIHK